MIQNPLTGPAELLRLLHNIARVGVIAEVDLVQARVRVATGELLTGWVNWLSTRAGGTRDWDPPTVGEQVLLISPGGDLAAGVALTGLFRAEYPAPSADPALWRREFPDGAQLSYHHGNQIAELLLPAGAVLRVVSDGGIEITGDVQIAGDVAIDGSLAASADVADGTRSMAEDRQIFNGHTHQQGVVPPPDQEQ